MKTFIGVFHAAISVNQEASIWCDRWWFN